MKNFLALLIFLFSHSAFAKEVVYRDNLGMPRCIEGQEAVLLVWDPLVSAPGRPVFGISLKDYARNNNHYLRSCADWSSAVKWPEGLALISEFDRDFSEPVKFAIQQLSEGAKKLRIEKTGGEFIAAQPDMFRPKRPVDFGKMNSELGTPFTNEVVKSWIQRLQSTRQLDSSKCEKLIGTCDYYLCLESTHQCGVSGYPVGYGYKYCNRSLFGLHQRMKSQQGREWVTKTVQCLQTKIQAELKAQSLSCSQIERKALDSHPECYVDSGFCGIPLQDKMKIFETVNDQLLKTDTLSQGAETIRRCGANHE